MVAAGALLAYAPLPAVVPVGDLLGGAALAQSGRGDGGDGGNRGAIDVGIYIEEKDLVDIAEAADNTDDEALDRTYANLLAGSENHLAAFLRQAD